MRSRKLDESKLTEAQKRALAIAKAQGVNLIRRMDELWGDFDPELVDKTLESILEARKQGRQAPIVSKFK